MNELINDTTINAAKKDTPRKGKGGGGRKSPASPQRNRNKSKNKRKDESSGETRSSEVIKKVTYDLMKAIKVGEDGDEPDDTDDGSSIDYIEPQDRGRGLDFNVLKMTVGMDVGAFKGSQAERVKLGYAILNRFNEEMVTVNEQIKIKQEEIQDTLNDLVTQLTGGARVLTEDTPDIINVGGYTVNAADDGTITVTDSSDNTTEYTDDFEDEPDRAASKVRELLASYGMADEENISKLKTLTSEMYTLKAEAPPESDLVTILRMILPPVAYDSKRINRPNAVIEEGINVINEDAKMDEAESLQIVIPLYDKAMYAMTGVGKLIHNIGAAAIYIEEQLSRGINISVMDANELVHDAIIRGERLLEGKSTLFDEVKIMNEIVKRGYNPLALFEIFKLQFSDAAKRIFSKRTETGNPLSENLVFEILKEFYTYDTYKLRSLTLMDDTTSLTKYRNTDEVLDMLSYVELINDKQKARLDKIVADKTPKE